MVILSVVPEYTVEHLRASKVRPQFPLDPDTQPVPLLRAAPSKAPVCVYIPWSSQRKPLFVPVIAGAELAILYKLSLQNLIKRLSLDKYWNLLDTSVETGY